MSSDEELIQAHREILSNRGIVAYVDVWQDDIMNYSELWQEKLVDMGAKVVKKWNKNVTHLVFKDGRPGMGLQRFSRIGRFCQKSSMTPLNDRYRQFYIFLKRVRL